MQDPEKPASPSNDQPRKMTDAEFFGVPNRHVSVVAVDKADMPDWYYQWLDGGRLNQDFVVWFDAWPAIEIFALIQTQWRHGFNGVTGLDYAAIIPVIALHYPYRPEQLEMLSDINAIETGAMFAFNEMRRVAEQKAEQERNKK